MAEEATEVSAVEVTAEEWEGAGLEERAGEMGGEGEMLEVGGRGEVREVGLCGEVGVVVVVAEGKAEVMAMGVVEVAGVVEGKAGMGVGMAGMGVAEAVGMGVGMAGMGVGMGATEAVEMVGVVMGTGVAEAAVVVEGMGAEVGMGGHCKWLYKQKRHQNQKGHCAAFRGAVDASMLISQCNGFSRASYLCRITSHHQPYDMPPRAHTPGLQQTLNFFRLTRTIRTADLTTE